MNEKKAEKNSKEITRKRKKAMQAGRMVQKVGGDYAEKGRIKV